MVNAIYIFIGTLSLGLGIIGIFTPGIPTTPFILLTAALYVKSSPTLYNKLITHRITGGYLNEFRNGFSLRLKIVSISIMWLMILTTVIWVITDWKWKLVLIIIGIIGTLLKLRLPGKK